MKKKNKEFNATEYNSPLLATHDFWGLPTPKPVDPTVYVWTDVSTLKYGKLKPSKLHDLDLSIDDLSSKDSYTSRVQAMAAVKAQEKEKRLHRLKNAIDNGEINSIQDALRATPEIKSDKTIHSYLKIIGRKLIDEKTGRYYGSDEANFALLDKSNNKSPERKIGTNYKYYDKDPNQGGVEISFDDYKALRTKLIEQYGGK